MVLVMFLIETAAFADEDKGAHSFYREKNTAGSKWTLKKMDGERGASIRTATRSGKGGTVQRTLITGSVQRTYAASSPMQPAVGGSGHSTSLPWQENQSQIKNQP